MSPSQKRKKHLPSRLCYGCDFGYYSSPNFDYKSSDCWKYCKKNGIMKGGEFGKRCEGWKQCC